MSGTRPDIFAEGGSLGALMRSHDWSRTPLGPVADWPQPLRTLVAVMLGSHQPMFVAWGPARTMLYNDGYAPMLGQRHPAALGSPFYEVWYDIREAVEPIMERAYAGQATHMDDIRFVMHRHGYPEETHFAFSYTPVRDECGAVAGMFCICTETTAKVLSARRQSFRFALEERLRGLSDPRAITAAAAEMLGTHLGAAQVGYCEVEPGATWFSVTGEWGDGRVPSVAGQHRMADFGPLLSEAMRAGTAVAVPDVHADARTRAHAEAFRALGIGAVIGVPLVKEGELTATLFVHEREGRVWSDTDLMLAREVAERTWAAVQRGHAEAALRESEARFRNMADHAPVMVWLTGPDDRTVWLSQTWYDFTGQEPGSGEGFGWLDAIHSDDRERSGRIFAAASARREAFRFEYRVRRRDGAWRWALDAGMPRFAADGTFMGYIGSVMEIAERKEAEEALRRAKEAAEQANLAKSRFLAAASHDLRQPMQSLFLFLEVLRPHVSAAGLDALNHFGRGLDSMRELLDGLLDMSRLDARVVQPEVEPFDVGPLIADLAHDYSPRAAEKGLAFRTEHQPARILSDRTLLTRMLRNLIENALRYTEAGGIGIVCRTEAGRLRIAVRDTGIGIPPEHLEHIWEEFHQVGNLARDRAQGLGLGLAIVQRLSRLLDHPVAVHSTPGRGSAFEVEVPLA